MERLPSLPDDGLTTPIVGEWGEEKYRLVRCYADIFARSMKNTWDCRVYIDLFSGSGRARLQDSQRIVGASPLLALGIRDPFDRYIFCDIDPERLSALRVRVERDFPDRKVDFIQGDSNQQVPEIVKLVPQHSTRFRVLTFCFVDPFRIENLKFETLQTLAAGDRKIDFLVLIPSGMDAQRNWQRDNALCAGFLGNPSWRESWEKQLREKRTFANFFVDEFAHSMERIGFRWNGLPTAHPIRNEKNSILYHLAFFSRAEIAERFWEECKKYMTSQTHFKF